MGKGECPFEGACFYKHVYPDGTKADLPMPGDRQNVGRKRGNGSEYATSIALFEILLGEFESFPVEVIGMDELYDYYDD